MSKKTDPATNKTEKTEAITPPAAPTKTKPPRKHAWSMGSIFWGLLFILVGTLVLLHNFGIAEVDLSRLWALWPLLIIAAGVSILPLRGRTATLIGALVVALMLGLVALTALGTISLGNQADTDTKNVSVEPAGDKLNSLSVEVEAGAGEITVASNPTTKTVEAELTSNVATLSHTSSTKDGVQHVTIKTEGARTWWAGGYENNLTVDVSQQLPVDLRIKAGASKLIADLSDVQLRSLNLDAGASDVDVRFGNRVDMTNVSFDIGASNVTFSVPRESGIRFELESGMSSKELPDLKETDKNTYESDNYDTASHKISFKGDLGMANLTLRYY